MNRGTSLNQSRKELVKIFPGLLDAKGPASEQWKIVVIYNYIPEKKMTWAMRMAESVLGQDLKTALSREQRGSDIARVLGVHPSTICSWRRILGI